MCNSKKICYNLKLEWKKKKKARIIIKINDHIIEGIGELNNNILALEKDDELIKFDLKKEQLTKKNKDLNIELDFINKIVTYELIEEKQKFSNNLVIFSLTNEDKQVMINYQIEQADFLLQINYETM